MNEEKYRNISILVDTHEQLLQIKGKSKVPLYKFVDVAVSKLTDEIIDEVILTHKRGKEDE